MTVDANASPRGCGASPPGPIAPDSVRTSTGVVRGSRAYATWSFKGIPCAAPPVGPPRFRPPQPPSCWEGVRDATELGRACTQVDDSGKAFGGEDCLTLNVWTPDVEPATKMPILVFVHGGANMSGSTKQTWLGEAAYDGAELASRAQAVVVTTNYRLGAFGFLALRELAAESPTRSSGNYGIRDLPVFAMGSRDAERS